MTAAKAATTNSLQDNDNFNACLTALDHFKSLSAKWKCCKHNNNCCYVEKDNSGKDIIHKELGKKGIHVWAIAMVRFYLHLSKYES